MEKQIIAIGGGEIKSKQTKEIDRYIAALAKQRSGEKRANALFLGAASHDSMPYFNSFRKTYTSLFDIKAEVALCVYGEMELEHIKEKFQKADMVYIGGGDTKFMLDIYKQKGILQLIIDAYERGVIMCGLSAGAVCWFENAYSDYDIIRGQDSEYKEMQGMGILQGIACPHYDERDEFDEIAGKYPLAYGLNNLSAIHFSSREIKEVIGDIYLFENGKKRKL
jgi:dipeptidase E